MQPLKMLRYASNVVDHGVIIFNQYAFALRKPMAEMIGAEYPRTLRFQRTSDVLITAEMLAVTVHQQRQKARSVMAPVMHGNIAMPTFDKADLLFRHRIFSSERSYSA